MVAASHQLINQTSGKVEYYTPRPIVEAARRTMGGIDLDPASSLAANELIGAGQIFTEREDGLAQCWFGRVWMNHPFGRIENPLWVQKVEREYLSGRVSEACCITYACTSEAWFKPLLLRPQCFLIPRTDYLLPDGSKKRGVTKGSVVTYHGPNVERFAEEFKSLGIVKIRLEAA